MLRANVPEPKGKREIRGVERANVDNGFGASRSDP